LKSGFWPFTNSVIKIEKRTKTTADIEYFFNLIFISFYCFPVNFDKIPRFARNDKAFVIFADGGAGLAALPLTQPHHQLLHT
jgi:hypothetical protein